MSTILFRGGRVIDPASGIDGHFDIVVKDGAIAGIERPSAFFGAANALTIDLAGKWIVPGLIDPHVHLRDPGYSEKETLTSGLKAAAAGGFTAVAAMANTSPVNDSPEITRYMLDAASRVNAARLVPVSAVTRGLAGREPVNYEAMMAAGARLFSDDGAPIDDETILLGAYERINRLGFAISLHEEECGLSEGRAINAGPVAKKLGVAGIPDSAETSRVRRDLALAVGSGAAVHIAHVSAAVSATLIRAARARGANVTCEITPHHFTLDDTAVLESGPDAKMNPPLRSRENVEALRAAMADGTIDMIATDHAPHDPGAKQACALNGCFPRKAGGTGEALSPPQADALLRAANGIVGLETAVGLAMRLVHDKLLTPMRMVEMMTLTPARLLRIAGGVLAPGAIADITVIDPDLVWTVDPEKFLSKSRNTPFAGMTLRGKPVMTLVNGEIVHDLMRQAESS
ncbi:MAG: dihydroorotase [Candidatus Binataceae bacterium]